MKKLTYEELNEIRNHRDILDGCLNRMCVTDDLDEFNYFSYSAFARLKIIKALNSKRFFDSEV